MAQGRIQYLNEKPFNGKTLYSFKLFDDDTLYMCGDKAPKAKKGDFVAFDYKQNPKGQSIVDTKTLTVKEAEVRTAAGSNVRESYWEGRQKSDDSRQRKIEWQAARNSAIAAADVILKNGALKMPAKEKDKYEAVLALIMQLTTDFYNQTQTGGEKQAMPTIVEDEDGHVPADGDDSQEESWDE